MHFLQIDQWKEFTILQLELNWKRNSFNNKYSGHLNFITNLPSYKNHDEGFSFLESSAILANTTDNFKSS